MPEFEADLIGRNIAGKFLMEQFLGGGAMGSVFRAKQIALDKSVAIKVLHRDMARDPAFVSRFHREAKHASRLDHPNSVRVIDFGEEQDGLLYIVMEYLDGRDLLTVMNEEWPLDDRRVAIILSQALAALAVAHDQGIIHRDLKPENIMVLPGTDDDGEPVDVVKVCDFGIATIAGAVEEDPRGARLTAKGLVMGTPDYMSPEQARGEKLDPRTDIYSMGVVLYHLLTGRTPFIAESALGIALKHVTDPVVPPSEVRDGVDPGLERICLRALEKSRDARFASARQMRAELRSVLEARGKSLPKIAAARASGGVSHGSGPHSDVPSSRSSRAPGTMAFEKRSATIGYEAPAPTSRDSVRVSQPIGSSRPKSTMAFDSSSAPKDLPAKKIPARTSPLLMAQAPLHNKQAATLASAAVTTSEPPPSRDSESKAPQSRPLFISERPVHDREADTEPPPASQSARAPSVPPVARPPTFEQLDSNEIQVMVPEAREAAPAVAEPPPRKKSRGGLYLFAVVAAAGAAGAFFYQQQRQSHAPTNANVTAPAATETKNSESPSAAPTELPSGEPKNEPPAQPSVEPAAEPSTEPSSDPSAPPHAATSKPAAKATTKPLAAKEPSKPPTTTTTAAVVEAPAPPPTPSPVVAAPPPTPTTPPAATPPPAPAVVAPAKPDAATAVAAITGVTATNGLSPSNVRNAIAHVPFQKCYRDAVAASAVPLTGTGTLKLGIAETGHVDRATLVGNFPAAMKTCIESAARAVTVKNVDTGEVTANVTVSFTHK